ncbi:MAG: four helix bundle protein [Chitinophagaceae bacterium]|nr:four helix bundle protein [Chitinophagaceae bacterium]
MRIGFINSNPILKLTFEFSLMIIEYCSLLETERKFVIANQLLKSGTSIGANAMEAQNTESKADFIHKFKIELRKEETQYWLLLCKFAPQLPDCDELLTKLEEIQKIISSIISSSKDKN